MVYDKKYLIKCLIGIFAMVALMYLTKGSGFIIMVPLLLWASFVNKPETLLFLLLMSIAMLVGNGNLMPKNAVFGFSQRISMMLLSVVMIAQIAGRRNSPFTKPFLLVIPYLLWMVLSSLKGWCPFISFLKLFLFVAIYFAYYGIANVVSLSRKSDYAKMRSAFLALAIFFIFGSVALIPFPEISQLGSEAIIAALKAGEPLTSLFTGMTFHSQSLGPVCAALGVALFVDLVFGVRRLDRLYLLLLLCVPLLIWKTSSRTAMGSFILGIMISVVLVANSRTLVSGWRMKIVNVMFGLFLLFGISVLFIPSARNRVLGFALKYNRERVSVSQMNSNDVFGTRLGKWDQGIYNFKKSPLLGNGFQVSEDMSRLKPSLGILSAPIEKSVWVSAVLEEGGFVGFVLLALAYVGMLLTFLKRKAHMAFMMLVMLLLTNLGEFTMFSMSGLGGFEWALVFVGVMLDAKRLFQIEMGHQDFIWRPYP